MVCLHHLARSMSTSINIKYENVDWRALINHEPISTGGSRYFQWVGKPYFSVYSGLQ